MAKGKYAGVIEDLPRYDGHEPEYQDKVNEVKATMVTDHSAPDALAHLYRTLRSDKDKIEEQLSDVNLRLEACSQLMTDAFENAGVSSLRLDTGESVSTQFEPYAKVVDPETYRLWCIANGYERKLQMPWQSTNAMTKERLLAGTAAPDGVTATVKVKIVLRKG